MTAPCKDHLDTCRAFIQSMCGEFWSVFNAAEGDDFPAVQRPAGVEPTTQQGLCEVLIADIEAGHTTGYLWHARELAERAKRLPQDFARRLQCRDTWSPLIPGAYGKFGDWTPHLSVSIDEDGTRLQFRVEVRNVGVVRLEER